MPLYTVEGLDRDTGAGRRTILEATDENDAVLKAGFVVERVIPMVMEDQEHGHRSSAKAFFTRRLVITAVVFCVVGYFTGREHVKYQIRSAITSVAEALQERLETPFPTPLTLEVPPL